MNRAALSGSAVTLSPHLTMTVREQVQKGRRRVKWSLYGGLREHVAAAVHAAPRPASPSGIENRVMGSDSPSEP